MKPPKLYFVTRADLTKGQAAAQCIHVMNEWAKAHGVSPPQEHVVVYKVKGESALLDIYRDLKHERNIDVEAFYEPDFGDEMTAIATREGPMELRLL